DNFNEENSLTIYPNPADSEVYINFSLPDPSEVGISIINFTGQTVLQNSDKKKLDSGSHTIKVPVDSLSKGVYLARIKINNRVLVKKVIIE
ncbi:T9SS type A sorting domain-containing protein, partial [Flavobacterium sp.]|uniref:T9SS type A sorting domain-containing protein n=1 Tax=Flavobacterium sp. TaxID=239 RepID=UPI0038FBED6A